MRINKIAILILILTLLGSFVYFYEIRRAKRTKGIVKVEKIFNFDPEDVQEIVLTRKGQTILLNKEDNQWRIKKPFEGPADNDRTLDLLSVYDFGIVRVIDSTPSNYSEYGLDRSEIEFGIKIKGNPVFETLLIGGNNPPNTCCYAKVKGRPDVILIGIGYKRTITDYYRKIVIFMI